MIKETSGGVFDNEDSYLIFAAAASGALVKHDYPTVLVAVNEVRTAQGRADLDRLLDSGRKVMLDSGIFNLAMDHVRAHGITHDDALRLAPDEIDGFDQLWDLYSEIVTAYADRLWGVVELDQGGAANKIRTRERIEAELGITPMPVYHPLLDGWDYYDDLASTYDRICFGNIVQASPGDRLRLIHTAYERSRSYPHLWTHLLGLYPNPSTLALSMRGSADSSSWRVPLRWYPAWHGWAMLSRVSKYPPSMWGDKNTQGDDFDEMRIERICGITIHAAQMTVDAVREDTHR